MTANFLDQSSHILQLHVRTRCICVSYGILFIDMAIVCCVFACGATRCVSGSLCLVSVVSCASNFSTILRAACITYLYTIKHGNCCLLANTHPQHHTLEVCTRSRHCRHANTIQIMDIYHLLAHARACPLTTPQFIPSSFACTSCNINYYVRVCISFPINSHIPSEGFECSLDSFIHTHARRWLHISMSMFEVFFEQRSHTSRGANNIIIPALCISIRICESFINIYHVLHNFNSSRVLCNYRNSIQRSVRRLILPEQWMRLRIRFFFILIIHINHQLEDVEAKAWNDASHASTATLYAPWLNHIVIVQHPAWRWHCQYLLL